MTSGFNKCRCQLNTAFNPSEYGELHVHPTHCFSTNFLFSPFSPLPLAPQLECQSRRLAATATAARSCRGEDDAHLLHGSAGSHQRLLPAIILRLQSVWWSRVPLPAGVRTKTASQVTFRWRETARECQTHRSSAPLLRFD